ncbi:MAG: hypothetical protein HYU03_00060 [Thaumarchaeota archaeon]|nr:hypothetical protein [Nitrososphaerota archaeon]
MLIFSLLKGVPARTTKVVTVGGVLRREEMDIVMNPHDFKAVEAADFVKRKVGGKVTAISMGPDVKLTPIMKPLYRAEVFGVDEEVILSDRRMAGADTLATSYAVSLGVKRVIERHERALDDLRDSIKGAGYSDAVRIKAKGLYDANLLTNRVYSGLAAAKDSIVETFLKGKLETAEATRLLEGEKERIRRFVVLSGIKTTDGETGSVGPQVAESLAEMLGVDLPHVTYVEDFDIDPLSLTIQAERKIGRLVQKLEIKPPALLTIAPEYSPRAPDPNHLILARGNSYKAKVPQPMKWTADEIGAEPSRLGLAGSPTIVGPGVDMGRAPVQKVVGRSLVFSQKVEKFQHKGAEYGPFERGDLANTLPTEKQEEFRNQGIVSEFSLAMLQDELFA